MVPWQQPTHLRCLWPRKIEIFKASTVGAVLYPCRDTKEESAHSAAISVYCEPSGDQLKLKIWLQISSVRSWTKFLWCVIFERSFVLVMPFFAEWKGDPFLTVIYLLTLLICGQLLSSKEHIYTDCDYALKKVTTAKSACNHVSCLKSVRSGLGLFYEVLALSPSHFLVAKWRGSCGVFQGMWTSHTVMPNTHTSIFLWPSKGI